MNETITRRTFLGKLIASTFLFVGVGRKKTAWSAAGSDTGSLRLVYYTDIHARTEWETPAAMMRAADAINAQNSDIVLNGGDLIADGFQSSATSVEPRWDAYMKMHRAIDSDVYPAIGNHDLVAAVPEDGSVPAENPRSVYLQHMGLDQTYFSFNAVGYHFIILDSIHLTDDKYLYHGTIWPEQLEWLKRDLASVSKATPIVLVTHMPLLTSFFTAAYGSTFAAPPNRVVVNNRDVLKLIEAYNIILVLQGHMHVKEMIRWKNATFITGGAVCGKWWRGSWYGTPEGFNLITLTGNRIDWEYLGYGWSARRPVNK